MLGKVTMRCVLFSALLAVLTVAVWNHTNASTRSAPVGSQSLAESQSHPVILELFTSEGCSSCPPADAFLKRLDDAGHFGPTELIAIEEHVDYWDRLGWTDPYSSADWTARQQQYADFFRRDAIYTPQLVVNGTDQTGGNNERQALAYIAKASTAPAAAVQISSINVSPKSAELVIDLQNVRDEMKSSELWVAVTERGLSSNVLHGENEGRVLTHAAVLRSLTRVRTHGAVQAGSLTATAKVSLPAGWKRENLRLVVFLQQSKSLQIVGAAARTLPR